MKWEMNSTELNELKTEIGSRDIIIIDESSFIGINGLCVFENALRQVGQKDKLWGGFFIIYCGDFNQLKSVGDLEMYKPEQEDTIENMLIHNDIIEDELNGEINIAKIDEEVMNKQYDEMVDLNGEQADKELDENEMDGYDKAKAKINKYNKKERLKVKLKVALERYYSELFPSMHKYCFELYKSER